MHGSVGDSKLSLSVKCMWLCSPATDWRIVHCVVHSCPKVAWSGSSKPCDPQKGFMGCSRWINGAFLNWRSGENAVSVRRSVVSKAESNEVHLFAASLTNNGFSVSYQNSGCVQNTRFVSAPVILLQPCFCCQQKQPPPKKNLLSTLKHNGTSKARNLWFIQDL